MTTSDPRPEDETELQSENDKTADSTEFAVEPVQASVDAAGTEDETGEDEPAAEDKVGEDKVGEGGTDAPEPAPEPEAEPGGNDLLPPPGPDDVAAVAPPKERSGFLGWSRSPAAILVGILIGLLGFALAVQVRSNTSTSGLPAARQEDLVRILDDLSSREDRLRRQIAELEAARTRLSTAGDRSSTALQEARKRSTALGILAGTVPAQGPGIELTIADPERRLAAEDLLDAVEELRAAGAEAIQVGGVRVGLDTAFTATDRGIAVDGVSVASPYTILAIGEPATLATAMDIPGGVSDTARRAGGGARSRQLDRVVIRAVRTAKIPRYSQPGN